MSSLSLVCWPFIGTAEGAAAPDWGQRRCQKSCAGGVRRSAVSEEHAGGLGSGLHGGPGPAPSPGSLQGCRPLADGSHPCRSHLLASARKKKLQACVACLVQKHTQASNVGGKKSLCLLSLLVVFVESAELLSKHCCVLFSTNSAYVLARQICEHQRSCTIAPRSST